MSSFIDLTNPSYNNLSTYGVLANDTITTSQYTPILNNGFYGTTNSTYTPTPVTFTPQGSPQGINQAGTTSAQGGLTQLITDINNIVLPILPLSSAYTGQTITLLGGKVYKPTLNLAFTDSTIIFDNGGNPNAQFFIISPGYIALTRVTFVLNDVNPCNIFWLAGSYIEATYVDTALSPMYGNFISGTYLTLTYPSSITGHLYSKTALTITPQTSVNTTTINTTTCPVVCYAKGTLILTKNGFVPIENIKAGHKVVTKGKIYKNRILVNESSIEIEPVVWISKFKVFNLNTKSRPICIKKDALGKNYPFKDLYVSPGHSLLINGKMVLAKNMVNGKTIYQDTQCNGVEYYHLECEHHSAIFANGVLSESYLDLNNRDVFENSTSLRQKPNIKKLYALR